MIRRRRYSDYHQSKTSHERWLVSYADFITLLFAFFVVMYSVSQVSERKYQVLSETLSSIFEGKVPVDSAVKELVERYPLDDKGQIQGLSPEINLVETKVLAESIQQSLVHLVDPSEATVSATESWVQIEVNANLLFDSGSAAPSREARIIFDSIAQSLIPYENGVEVSGFTDNIPINTPVYSSNWELSAARASSIVRLLEGAGVAADRLSAVGHGENHPIASNDTTEGRSQNRRVVVKIAKHGVEKPEAVLNELATQFPLAPLDSGEPVTAVDSSEDVDPTPLEGAPSAPEIEPVRLKNGGLLFTSDPELPRQ